MQYNIFVSVEFSANQALWFQLVERIWFNEFQKNGHVFLRGDVNYNNSALICVCGSLGWFRSTAICKQ